MSASFRLIVCGIVVGLWPAAVHAQIGHRLRLKSQPTPTEISNHLRGYFAGNHNHGGYGYGGGAGYGFAGGGGPTYGGGFLFPGYGNTYGFYPYGNGYNFSAPNFAPPAALSSRVVNAPPRLIDPATGLPLAPPETASPAPAAVPLD